MSSAPPAPTTRASAASHGIRLRHTLTSLSAPYTPGSNWHLTRDDSISFPPPRSGRGVKGPRTLSAMCLRLLADNIAAADADILEVLPSTLRLALWKELAPR